MKFQSPAGPHTFVMDPRVTAKLHSVVVLAYSIEGRSRQEGHTCAPGMGLLGFSFCLIVSIQLFTRMNNYFTIHLPAPNESSHHPASQQHPWNGQVYYDDYIVCCLRSGMQLIYCGDKCLCHYSGAAPVGLFKW